MGAGDQALGRSRGGFGTKIHLRVEGQGKPIAFVLTPGQRHEASGVEELMTQGAVRRSGHGGPRVKPQRVCGDKGYSIRRIRAYLRRRGIRYTIPRKINERRTGPFNRALYRQRNLVERTINRLKQFRRIATRYEKKAKTIWLCRKSCRCYSGCSLQTRSSKFLSRGVVVNGGWCQ